MAVGVVIGGADFTQHKLVLKTADEAIKSAAVTLNYGAFITAVVDFTIVAFAVFMLVKVLNSIKRSAPAPAPTTTEKQCGESLSNIPIKAKRCSHCAQPQTA
ncbi:MAG: MscL family protein [Elusimicrobiota bacterium]